MVFTRKLSVFRSAFIVACGFMIYGCASSGIQTPTGEQAMNVIAAFERGEARLNCRVSCSGAWGLAQSHAKALYDQGLWRDLAIEVARVGLKADQTYFYLGRAAEGLGHTEAALTYYKLGLASSYKCAGIINVCDGLIIPVEIAAGINRLPISAKAEAPIIANTSNLAGPRENISTVKMVPTKSQPIQVSTGLVKTPSEIIEPPQVDLRSTGREEDTKSQEDELLREETKRKEQELRDQETAEQLEREKKVKQQEDADRREAESKKKARAMIRKATTQERSLIISAVNQTLLDSESARYSDIYLIQDSLACAEVNAKNRFGGYTGFQSVVAMYTSGRWISLLSLRDKPISCLDLIAEMHMKNN